MAKYTATEADYPTLNRDGRGAGSGYRNLRERTSFGEIQIGGNAHLGDNVVQNNHYFGTSGSGQKDLQHEILSILAYGDMNRRRNQLRNQAASHFDWIWSEEQETDSQGQVNEAYQTEKVLIDSMAKVRSQLADRWGFDSTDDSIWDAICTALVDDEPQKYVNKPCPRFRQWLDSSEPMFWISGKPASGKSSLMSYIATSEQTSEYLASANGAEWHLLSFFFDYRAHTGLANSLEGMMRSLLFQVFSKVPELAQELLGTTSLGNLHIRHNELSVIEMVDAIVSRIPKINTRLCIFVDGLDEYDGSYIELLKITKRLADGKYIRVCLASRPVLELSYELKSISTLNMQDYNHATIVTLLRDTFDAVAERMISDAEKWSLICHILQKSQGVILWCQLVATEIRKSLLAYETFEELENSIEDCKSGVEHIYMRILEQISPRYVQEASYMLLLIHEKIDRSVDRYSDNSVCDIAEGMHVLSLMGKVPSYPPKTLKAAQLVPRLQSRLGGLIDIVDDSFPEGYEDLDRIRTVHKTFSTFLQSAAFLKSPMAIAFIDYRSSQFVWLELLVGFLELPQHLSLWQTFVASKPTASAVSTSSKHDRLLDSDDKRRARVEIIAIAIKQVFFMADIWRDLHIEIQQGDSSEFKDLVCSALRAPVVWLHGTELIPETARSACSCINQLTDRVRATLSGNEISYYLCISHGLLPFAESFPTEIVDNVSLFAACGYSLLMSAKRADTLKARSKGHYEDLYSTVWLWKAEEMLVKFAPSMHPTPLVGLMAEIGLHYQEREIVWYLLANAVVWSTARCDLDEKWYIRSPESPACTLVSSNSGIEVRLSYSPRWREADSVPRDSVIWAETDGLGTLSCAVMMRIFEGDLNTLTSAVVLASIDLALLVDKNINEKVYYNGSILHLWIEYAPPAIIRDLGFRELGTAWGMFRNVIRGLLRRNVDPTTSGALGTARQMLEAQASVAQMDEMQQIVQILVEAETTWTEGIRREWSNPWASRMTKRSLVTLLTRDRHKFFPDEGAFLVAIKDLVDKTGIIPPSGWKEFVNNLIIELRTHPERNQDQDDLLALPVDEDLHVASDFEIE